MFIIINLSKQRFIKLLKEFLQSSLIYSHCSFDEILSEMNFSNIFFIFIPFIILRIIFILIYSLIFFITLKSTFYVIFYIIRKSLDISSYVICINFFYIFIFTNFQSIFETVNNS